MARILVVDDESDFLLGLSAMLEFHEHEAITVGSGREALDQKPRPDLALLDLRMPGMNGVELARRLRHRWPGLPVIFMTAANLSRLQGEAERIGRVLDKALIGEQLAQAITESLKTADE